MRTTPLIHTATIQVRQKKKIIPFSSGTVAFTAGDTVTGTSGDDPPATATGTIESIVLESGSWGAGTAAGYLVVTGVSGSFVNGMLLADEHTGSATQNGEISDYENTYGENEYTWETSQSGVSCRFYYQSARGSGLKVHAAGEVQEAPLSIMLPSTVIINDTDYRITTTQAGFSGTYAISRVLARTGRTGIDHYEVILQEVPD